MTTVTEVRTQELTNDLSISRQSPHYMEIYRPQRGPLVPVRGKYCEQIKILKIFTHHGRVEKAFSHESPV